MSVAPEGCFIIGVFVDIPADVNFVPRRLETKINELSTKFITSNLVDMFNKIKCSIDKKGSNTVCTPQRALGVCIDKDVVGSTHRYEQVDWRKEVPERSFSFGHNMLGHPYYD